MCECMPDQDKALTEVCTQFCKQPCHNFANNIVYKALTDQRCIYFLMWKLQFQLSSVYWKSSPRGLFAHTVLYHFNARYPKVKFHCFLIGISSQTQGEQFKNNSAFLETPFFMIIVDLKPALLLFGPKLHQTTFYLIAYDKNNSVNLTLQNTGRPWSPASSSEMCQAYCLTDLDDDIVLKNTGFHTIQ